jgi:hypothetical protein
MLRRPLFWIVFAALSAGAAIFTFKNFSTAFPLVSIDLKMDRADALRTARMLAQKNMWPPGAFDQAAEFSADQSVQNFIELEGGGKPELSRILKDKIFAPYTWIVRHFKEGDAHETVVRFTPEGLPYGFRVKLPEQEKGASKPAAEAQQIAEAAAKADWTIDFSRYQLVESSKDDRPGGRTDHTFVYERQDERAGEGRYRMRLVVSGDKLTELTQFVRIPEAFTRRYEQLRSANDAINAVSTIAFLGAYLLGFCVIGLFIMMRRHWVLWRQPVLWGLFIAVLMGLQQLNMWPLLWMSYDTAVSSSGFAVRQVMGAFANFGLYAVVLTVTFMAAETLSRRAFPHHVQLWKVWSPGIASSRTVFGETAAGYLLVAPFFAYEIVLYFFAQGKLGWWTPSDALVNPDMFANYLPSLSAVAQAAQAGFWEECLFRAAPLAVAALLGNKFRKRRLFIGVAMILQALVFASGHAGYANQPAYSRVVELIIPSFAFGALYLAFGLLPGIVLHFAYDATWMALPLFVASGARARAEQLIVVFVVLVPLWVVLVNRKRSAKWFEIPDEARNGAWLPPHIEETTPLTPRSPSGEITDISPSMRRVLPILGLAGLIAWIAASAYHTDAPSMQIQRGAAIEKAREAFAARGISFGPEWTVLSHVEGQPGEVNRFVWQKAGRPQYAKLLGVYVTPPSWAVRFARFHGDVAERAEEYQADVDGAGRVFRVNHTLPEATPGKNLTQDEARMIAVRALDDPANFKEVSAEAARKPARTDWTFAFKDTRPYGLPEGEPRISVEVDGDQVADTVRYVYVPDEWKRNERSQRNLPTIVGIVCTVLVVAIVVTFAVVGIVHWSRRRPFSAATFGAVFATLFLTGALNLFNSWPVLASVAQTTQPLALQLGIILSTSLVVSIFSSAALALVAGLVGGDLRKAGTGPLSGIFIGLLLAGAGAVARHAAPLMSPTWGNFGPASMVVPLGGAAFGSISAYFTQTLILLAVVYALALRPSAAWIWIPVGLALAGVSSVETMTSWIILGVTTGAVLLLAYRLVFQHQPELLIVMAATLAVLSTLRDGLQNPYSGALPGSLLGAAMIVLSATVWYKGWSHMARNTDVDANY